MKGLPVFNWLVDILNQLHKLTDRPIVVRTHPGDKKSRLYTDKIRFPRVTISKKQNRIIETSKIICDLEQFSFDHGVGFGEAGLDEDNIVSPVNVHFTGSAGFVYDVVAVN